MGWDAPEKAEQAVLLQAARGGGNYVFDVPMNEHSPAGNSHAGSKMCFSSECAGNYFKLRMCI